MRARVEGGRELRGRRPLVALLLLALALASALLPACGTRSTSAAPTADARDAASGCARASRGNKRSRFREMTWEEYYTEVRERAWRNAATIIWITPPTVKRRRPPAAVANSGASSANTTACAR